MAPLSKVKHSKQYNYCFPDLVGAFSADLMTHRIITASESNEAALEIRKLWYASQGSCCCLITQVVSTAVLCIPCGVWHMLQQQQCICCTS